MRRNKRLVTQATFNESQPPPTPTPTVSLPIPSQERLEFFHAKKNRGQEETNYDLVCVLFLNYLIYRPRSSDYG